MTRLTNWFVDADEAHPAIPYWQLRHPPRASVVYTAKGRERRGRARPAAGSQEGGGMVGRLE